MNFISKKSEILKVSYIKKIKDKWHVFSEKGKNMGVYDSEKQAKKRLQQIEFFKHKKASCEVDLSHLKELSYSGIMRELRKKHDRDTWINFLKIYKKFFDIFHSKKISDFEDLALKMTIKVLGYKT